MSSRFYHRKLAKEDEKPLCSSCNQISLYYCTMNDEYYCGNYYCTMNDEYYCGNHILGHDENE